MNFSTNREVISTGRSHIISQLNFGIELLANFRYHPNFKLMKKHLFKTLLLLSFFAFGCGATQNRIEGPVLRAAINTPEFFETKAGVVATGNSCINPMIDPTDGTEITMVTAFGNGTGDYKVVSGKYGVGQGELLRINCRTGEVIGIVKR